MSSATENKMLVDVAGRLGLGDETHVIKKSGEFLRFLSTKATTVINGYSKIVLCLDLACRLLEVGFDKETAYTLSGLKSNIYQKSLNTLETVLKLDKLLTIKEACVKLSCPVVKDFAEQILAAYQKHNSIADLTRPQYVSVAVYTACKIKSVKVQKSKFISISHLKTTEWKELENEFDRFVAKMGLNADVKAKTKGKAKHEMHASLDEFPTNLENSPTSPVKDNEECEEEDYEVWKFRILTAAKLALLES